MADEVIMLAKGVSFSKINFPCVVTEKLDGVAADFYYKRKLGQVHVRSRQDKEIKSVAHICRWLDHKLPDGHHVICELYIPGYDFKDISGMSRQHENAPELCAFIYDYYVEGSENMTYKARMNLMAETIGEAVYLEKDTAPVKLIGGKFCPDEDALREYLDEFSAANPDAEGVVIRSLEGKDSEYKFGRSWGMQKLKTTLTLDLEVHSFEEAVDKNGKPKGMVGRINVLYDTGASSDGKNDYTDFSIIGAGPGKLTHAERTEIWRNQAAYKGRIAEIAYMKDDAYDSLREPRFLRWREDKTKPSQE